jgi:adenosylmethionine-8-amino-7-oxononanoate aminotransferase
MLIQQEVVYGTVLQAFRLQGKSGIIAYLNTSFPRDSPLSLAKDPWVGDIRQCGYMVGIGLVQNQQTKEPFPMIDRIGHHVGLTARTLGLLIRPIGNTMILMPPLSATLQELQQMTDILKVAISVVRASKNTEYKL